MSIFDVVSIIFGVVFIIWGMYFFVKRKEKDARFFSLFTFFTGLWIVFVTITNYCFVEKYLIFLYKICTNLGLLAILFFLCFVSFFRNNKIIINRFLLMIIFIFVLLVFVLPGDIVVKDIQINYDSPPRGQLNILITYVFISLLFYMIFKSFYTLFSGYKNLDSLKRSQIRYVALGGVISIFGAILFDVVLPWVFNDERFYSLGPLSFVFFIAFTSYAIIKHQLLDIRIVIQRGIIYSFSLAIVVSIYLLSILLLSFVLNDKGIVTMTGAMVAIIIGIYGVPIIERYFKRKTDKIFFKDRYDYSKELYDLSEILNNNINLEVLLEKTFNKLKKIFKVKKARIVLLEQELVFDENANLRPIQEDFSIGAREAIINHERAVITGSDIDYLIEKINKEKDVKDDYRKILKLAKNYEKKYHFEVFVAMVSRRKLIGLILLGPKMSGDVYNGEDINLLKTFAHQAAVALEKAQLYEKAKDYSRELEKKVKKRTSRIKGLQEEQKQMMLEIAHGLQTPLTIIKGQLSILQKEIKDTEKLDSLEKSIDRISRFIYAMLRSAKLDSRDRSEHIPIDLSALLEEFLESVHIITQEKNIKIVNDIKEGIYIMGNKSEIEELLMNLISNSVKYMDDNRDKRVIINLYRHKNRHNKAVLTIEDTGIGINQEHLPNLFSKFYRIKDDMKTKGTGLGLVICKKIIEKHNGRIRVESLVGRGTKFIIDFPLEK